MTESVQKDSDGSLRVYEAGYILLPSIPEEKVGDEVSLIKDAILKHGGVFMSEVSPKFIPLAYEVIKNISSKNERFTDAYFGAIHFKALSSAIPALTRELDENQSIIRFLLIKAEKEPRKQPKREVKLESETEEVAPSLSQTEIDKSIEEMVKA